LRASNVPRKKALIGYVTAGYPKKQGFASLVTRLDDAGLDCVGNRRPFSDPVADGDDDPAALRKKSLENGVTLDWILKLSHCS